MKEIPGLSAHSFAVLTFDSPKNVYRLLYNYADCVAVNIYTDQFFSEKNSTSDFYPDLDLLINFIMQLSPN